MKIAISEIIIGPRHRKDLGDIKALAESIDSIGLMQPIGITKDNVLVFGERRLIACRDLLGWTMIPARIVDVPSIVDGEYAENEIRKDFTPSERVAIAEAVKATIGERRGNPELKPNVHDGAQLEPGRKTRDIVAAKAGFGSHKSYESAKRVVDKGIPELVEAMDKGEVSISKAADIASLPTEQQSEAMKPIPKPTPKPKPKFDKRDGLPMLATEAMQFAVMAIAQLERIRPNDPKNDEALRKVINWCNKHMRGKD